MKTDKTTVFCLFCGMLLLVTLIVVIPVLLMAAHRYEEKDYQDFWCAQYRGTTEYVLDDGKRVDCFTKEYAIEFDFAPKWAEAVGQSLYYAIKTKKKPGIVLIVEEEGENEFVKRLKPLCDKYNIKLWFINPQNLPKRKLLK